MFQVNKEVEHHFSLFVDPVFEQAIINYLNSEINTNSNVGNLQVIFEDKLTLFEFEQ